LSTAKHDSGSFRHADDRLLQAHAFVEDWLTRVLPLRDAAPRRLHCAMHEAVFPGGRGARPMLCPLVAELHGGGDVELVGRFSAALELVHCAAQVQHDSQSHAAYGSATAMLAGDALLTLAFDTLAQARVEPVAFRLMGLLAAATGSSHGIIGARAMNHETVALFRAAALGGAILGGAEGESDRWARVGERVGAAVHAHEHITMQRWLELARTQVE
jgi:geranylgeranyl pyrophosphate synthase